MPVDRKPAISQWRLAVLTEVQCFATLDVSLIGEGYDEETVGELIISSGTVADNVDTSPGI